MGRARAKFLVHEEGTGLGVVLGRSHGLDVLPQQTVSAGRLATMHVALITPCAGVWLAMSTRTGETQWEPPVQASPPSPSFQPRGEPAVITRDHGRPRDAAHVHAAAFEDAARAPQVPPAVLATLTSLMSRMAAMQDELNSMSVELAGVCSLLTIHRSTTNTRRGEPARNGGGDGFRQ